METCLEIFAEDLTEIDDATFKNDAIDMSAPSLAPPTQDKPEPMREYFLTDNDDPALQ
jgi:hypothetical protein